jgi:hypothetical protein
MIIRRDRIMGATPFFPPFGLFLLSSLAVVRVIIATRGRMRPLAVVFRSGSRFAMVVAVTFGHFQ